MLTRIYWRFSEWSVPREGGEIWDGLPQLPRPHEAEPHAHHPGLRVPGGEQLFAEAHGGCTRVSSSFVAAIGLELDLRREVSVVGAGLVGWAESEGGLEKVGKPKPPQIACSEAPQVLSSPREQARPQRDLFPGLKTRACPEICWVALARVLPRPDSATARKPTQNPVPRGL